MAKVNLAPMKEAINDFSIGKTSNFSNKQFIAWISSCVANAEAQEEVLTELYNQLGQDMDINPSAKCTCLN